MTPTMTGFVSIGVLLIILFSRMPIAFGMGLIGFLGFAYLVGVGPALGLLKTVPYSTFASHSLSVIPLFILMGAFAFSAGLSKDLYEAAYKWLGHLRGGLAMATVGACACFAAISGSSMATAATMGTVALPEMKKYKYDPALATGAVAAGGSMGILIPPSVILIIYGIITEQSIGKLFLAGFIPGVRTKNEFHGKNEGPFKDMGGSDPVHSRYRRHLYRRFYTDRSRRDRCLRGVSFRHFQKEIVLEGF